MNKKGFTLIEILSTITIMGLIATMVSVNAVKIFNDEKKRTEETKNNIISTAACTYIELSENKSLKDICLTKGCTITTEELIKNGLLNEEDVDRSKVINIYKENNEKKCIVKEN